MLGAVCQILFRGNTMTTATVTQTPEHKAASDASKKAMTAVIKNGVLTITCPVIERVSTKGKTVLVANAKKQLAYKSDKYGDQIINVACNSYFYNPNFTE